MLTIPERFTNILSDASPELKAQYNTIIYRYSQILEKNEIIFFPEYTDHGIKHVNMLLASADNLIADDSFKLFEPNEIVIFIFSAILHDLGMHMSISGFKNMISGIWDDNIIDHFDSKNWSDEWYDYLKIAQRFSDQQQINIWGKCGIQILNPDFNNINEIDRKLIGEFLRRNHPRLAHEIAINGFPTNNGHILLDGIDPNIRELSGLIARSHGLSIRDTYRYLEKTYGISYKRPFNIKVIYWMAVLRISDYIQIQKDRAPYILFKIKSFSSPYSENEWRVHNCIEFINAGTDDPELLYVHAKPEDPNQFVKLSSLLKDIQNELDTSWAVIGETYGLHLKMNYRRITSNIYDLKEFSKKINYIPFLLKFKTDASLLKLLIAPLYNNDSSMAIRELIQNSIDACLERKFLLKEKDRYKEQIVINLTLTEKEIIFIIQDNGIGMGVETLKNYYFNSGRSYRNSAEWINLFTSHNKSEILRTGKFGVGALATFLLGDDVEVETRAVGEKQGLIFEMKAFEDSVQINKKYNIPIGTKIKVKLKKSIKDSIIYSINDSMDGRLKWFCHYLKENDFIEYNITNTIQKAFAFPNSNELIPTNLEENDEWSFFKINDNLQVYFTYRFTNNLQSESRVFGEIICNGFKITNGYTINERKFPWDLPTLYVEDSNSNLSLSLDRNSIYNNTVPFEKELVEQIAKDLILTLEDMDFDMIGDLRFATPTSLKYHAKVQIDEHVVCLKDYYTFNLPFMLRELKCNTIYTIVPKGNQRLNYNTIFKTEVAYRVRNDNSELYSWFSIQNTPRDLKKIPNSQMLFVDSDFRTKSRIRGEGSRYNFTMNIETRASLKLLNELHVEKGVTDPNVNMGFINSCELFNKISKNTFIEERELDIKWLVDVFEAFYEKDYRIPYDKSKRKSRFKSLKLL